MILTDDPARRGGNDIFPIPPPMWFLAVFCLILQACEGAVPTDLDHAAKVVKYLSSEGHLGKSSFPAKFPESKPSQFAEWMFSEAGKVEWPPTEDAAEIDPLVREKVVALGATLVPRRVAFVLSVPQADKSRQLVIKTNDAENMLIVEAYANPAKPPVFTRKWKIPKVEPKANKR